MRDRCALLATCKCARGTFSEITDTMDRLQLLFGEGFIQGLTDHIEGKLSLGGRRSNGYRIRRRSRRVTAGFQPGPTLSKCCLGSPTPRSAGWS